MSVARSSVWLLLSSAEASFPLWVAALVVTGVMLVYFPVSYRAQSRLWLSEVVVVAAAGIGLRCTAAVPWRVPNGDLYSGAHEPQDFTADQSTFQEVSGSAAYWMQHFASLVISQQLVALGLRHPTEQYQRRDNWREWLVLSGPVMLLTALVTAGLLWWLFGHRLAWWECWAIAAATSPTDPVIASALTRGRFAEEQLAPHVRRTLGVESAINDGAALPLVLLGVLLIRYDDPGQAMQHWFLDVWLYQVAMPILGGAAFGYAMAQLIHVSQQRDWANREELRPICTSISIFLLATGTLLGTNPFLLNISAAITLAYFVHASRSHAVAQEEMSRIAESLDLIVVILLSMAFFFVLATMFDFDAWSELGYVRLVAWAATAFIARRLPFVLASYALGALPVLASFKEALFVGVFAPVGGATVFYAVLLAETMEAKAIEMSAEAEGRPDEATLAAARRWHEAAQTSFHLCLWLIFASLVVHGLFGPAMAVLLRRYQAIDPEEAEAEKRELEMPNASQAACTLNHHDHEQWDDETNNRTMQHEASRDQREHARKTTTHGDGHIQEAAPGEDVATSRPAHAGAAAAHWSDCAARPRAASSSESSAPEVRFHLETEEAC